MTAGGLVERDAALRTIEAALGAVIAGRGGLVVIEGAPGTGRTALLDAAGDRAATSAVGCVVRGTLDAGVDAGAVTRPTVVLLDDDRAGARDLVGRTGREPLLVIAVAVGAPAEGLRRAATAAGGFVRTVVVEPLSEPAAEAVLHDVLPEATPDELRVRARDAGGSPFLLHELARRPPGGDPPPEVVRFSRAAIERAGPLAAAVAGAVAVLGAEATLRRVALVAGAAAGEVEETTQRLMEVGVFEARLPPAFVAPAVRRAVLAGVPLPARSKLHLSAAECLRADGLGPDVVAGHLVGTAAGGEPWVVRSLRDAAAHARDNGDPASAVAFLRRALLEPPAADERAAVLVELAGAESNIGDPAAARRLEETLRLLPEGDERARVRFRLGRLLVYSGAIEHGLAVLGQALDEVGDSRSDLAYRIETAFIAAARVDTRSVHLARARLARRREQPPPGDTPTERALLAELAYLEGLDGRRREVARDLALRAVGGEELAHVASLDASARHLALIVLMWTGELELVEQALYLARQLGRQHGNRLEEALAHELLAAVAQERGQVDLVVESIEACSRVLGQGALVSAPSQLARLAMARLDQGDVATARALVEGLDASSHAGSTLLHLFLVARARVRLATGQVDQALADALECGRGTAQLGNRNPGFPQWRAPAVEALARLGRIDEARRLADEEVALAEAWGLPRPLGVALAARALVVPEAERVRTLERAVDVLRRSPAVLELAKALLSLGRALRAVGREAEAAPVEVEARAIATRMGAHLEGATGPADPVVPAARATPCVEITLLDGFALRRDGEPVPLRGVPATLVKLLAVNRRSMHVEQVADRLWDDGDPASRTRLRNVMTRLRRAAGDVVRRDGETLRLAPEVRVDSWSFADRAGELLRPGLARDEAWVEAARQVQRLYTGDLLPEDPYADWAERPRWSLARLHLDLLEATAGALEALGRHDEAVPLVRRAAELQAELGR